MSLLHLALNPNLSDKDLCEIIKRRAGNTEKLMTIFQENLDKIESPEQKLEYISQCLPTLAMSFL